VIGQWGLLGQNTQTPNPLATKYNSICYICVVLRRISNICPKCRVVTIIRYRRYIFFSKFSIWCLSKQTRTIGSNAFQLHENYSTRWVWTKNYKYCRTSGTRGTVCICLDCINELMKCLFYSLHFSVKGKRIIQHFFMVILRLILISCVMGTIYPVVEVNEWTCNCCNYSFVIY